MSSISFIDKSSLSLLFSPLTNKKLMPRQQSSGFQWKRGRLKYILIMLRYMEMNRACLRLISSSGHSTRSTSWTGTSRSYDNWLEIMLCQGQTLRKFPNSSADTPRSLSREFLFALCIAILTDLFTLTHKNKYSKSPFTTIKLKSIFWGISAIHATKLSTLKMKVQGEF